MKFFFIILIFTIPLNLYSQKKIRSSELVGKWKFNTAILQDDIRLRGKGTIEFKSDNNLIVKLGIKLPWINYHVMTVTTGSWNLIEGNRLVYEYDSVSFVQFEESLSSYINKNTIGGLLDSDKISAYDNGYLILKDKDNREIEYKKMKPDDKSYFKDSDFIRKPREEERENLSRNLSKDSKTEYINQWEIVENGLTAPYKWKDVKRLGRQIDIPTIEEFDNLTLTVFMDSLNLCEARTDGKIESYDFYLIESYYGQMVECVNSKMVDSLECDEKMRGVMEKFKNRISGKEDDNCDEW